jgi:hypothetical protein
MLIIKGAITHLASRGYITTQVPNIALGNPQPDDEECPDEWFVLLHEGRPAIGKEYGIWHLTRIGWEANKDKIKQAFEEALAEGLDRTGGRGWEVFVEQVEEEFVQRKKKFEHYKKSLKQKLALCEEVVI